MIETTIYVSEDEVRRRLGSLQNRAGLVIARAANRSIDTGKKAIKQETSKIYNVRQKDTERILRVTKATSGNPVAILTYKDTHTNLYAFGRQTSLRPRYIVQSSDPVNPDPEYVKAKVFNKSRPVPLQDRPRPFVQKAKRSGVIALFQRTSNASRAPIRGVSAPALPQIIHNDDVMARFNRDAYSMFVKRLAHEIDHELKGAML